MRYTILSDQCNKWKEDLRTFSFFTLLSVHLSVHALNNYYKTIFQVCNQIRDCDDGLDELYCGDCSFEGSKCGYQSISSGHLSAQHEWKIGNNLTNLNGLYLGNDHTNGKLQRFCLMWWNYGMNIFFSNLFFKIFL